MKSASTVLATAILVALLSSAGAFAAAPPPPPGFNELPEGAYAGPMAAGSDGALWFGMERLKGGPPIGRIAAHGTLSEFELPGKGLGREEVGSLVTGPDGNLWFTRPRAHSIGTITPSGAVTEYDRSATCPERQVAYAECLQPTDMVAGGDGALWFAQPTSGSIGRLTTAGESTEFPLPRDLAPRDLAWGSDGALWFTQLRSNSVGRLTSVGNLTEFAIGRRHWTPEEIVAGSDGAMWFSLSRRSKPSMLGRITSAGAITRFPAPGVSIADLTLGPDGDIWMRGGIRSISPDGLMTAGLECPYDCKRPIESIGFDASGGLWGGLGVESCGYCGGGTTQTLHLTEHGFLGRLTPAPAAVHIAPGAEAVSAGGNTAMTLTCEEALPCAGELLLKTYVRSAAEQSPHRRSRGRNLVVADVPYELSAGSTGQLPIPLTARARAFLEQEVALRRVWAIARAPEHASTLRTVSLRLG